MNAEFTAKLMAQNVDLEALVQIEADRIAELENEITFRKGIYKDLCNVIDEYKKLTPKTKPLSNDEILEMTIWNKNLYELYVEMEKEDMIAFARAIEERHGIK